MYNVKKDVNDNPLETVQFEPAYGGDDYTLTDNPCYVTEDLKMSRDPHCVSDDRVTLQKQNYASLDPKTVQTSAYVPLVSNRNSSPAISKYRDNTNEYYIYEFPEKVVPRKKPSTQQTNESTNWNVISQQHGEGDQSSVDRKSSNKIPSTSGPGVKEVGKETTAPQKSQVFVSDVTMPTKKENVKKENISDTHHVMLPEKHEQREKVPPPTKPRPNTNKKQSTLSPTQESATPGVKGVGKETTAPRKSQVFVSDVTMPTKKENISDTHHVMLPEKHEQREKVPPPTKPRPNTNKKQSTLSPTQESATPGVKGVGKETTGSRKSQVFASDVTMPTKKENISDTHHLPLSKKHEQREKVPPPTKPRPNTNKKQSTLPPTQESSTPKPQAHPQQPNPVVTGSPSDAPSIPPKTKKRSFLPKKAFPVDTEQPPRGPNVTELRKIIEKVFS